MQGCQVPRESIETRLGGSDDLVFLEVSPSHPRTYRAHFLCLAETAQQEMPAFRQGYYGEDSEAEVDRRLIAAVRGTGAIGMLVVRRDSRSWLLEWGGPDLFLVRRDADQHERVIIERVWVAKAHRRTGLATRLLETASAGYKTTLADMTWQLPFMGAGRQLVHSLCPGRLFVDGDRNDLDGTIAGVRE